MTDSYDWDDYENDSKIGFIIDVHNFKFNNLTFSKYNKENEDEDQIINILDFDISNICVESIGKGNVKILYDNKPLKIKVISFCGLVKKDKDIKRNKFIKFKNRLASIKIWKLFRVIHELNSFKFFTDSMKVLNECEEWLPMYNICWGSCIFTKQKLWLFCKK